MADLEQALVISVRTDGTLEVTKLADSLNKIGEAAAKAGDKAGAGFASVSDALRAFRGGIGAAEGGVSGLVDSIVGLSQSFVPVIAGLAAAGAGFFVLKEAVGVAASAETAMKQLTSAIERTGASAATLAPEIVAVNQAIAATSQFSEIGLNKAAALFVTLTGNANQAAAAMAPIADLAAAIGVDVDTASRIVAKAGEGMTQALQRFGIVLTENQKKQIEAIKGAEGYAEALGLESGRAQILSVVLGAVNEKVGGAAASSVETYAGKVSQLATAWENLMVTLGSAVLPIISRVVSGIGAAIGKVQQFVDDLNKIGTAIGRGSPTSGMGPLGVDKSVEGLKQFKDTVDFVVDAAADKLAELAFRGGKSFDELADSAENATQKHLKYAQAVLDSTLGQTPLATALKYYDDLIIQQQTLAEQSATTAAALRQQSREFANFKTDIEIKFRPPVTGPIEAALREVQDKVDAVNGSIAAKVAALTDDILQEQAKFATLGAQLDAAGRTPGPNQKLITEDLRAQRAELEKQIAAQASLIAGYEKQLARAKELGEEQKSIAVADIWAKPYLESIDAVDQLIGSVRQLEDQETAFATAFEKLASAGVSSIQIADVLGPQFQTVLSLLLNMGKGFDDLSVKGRNAAETIVNGLEEIRQKAAALKNFQDLLNLQISSAGAAALPNLAGVIDFSQWERQIHDILEPALVKLQADLVGAKTDSDRKSLEAAIAAVQGKLDSAHIEAMTRAVEQARAAFQQMSSALGDVFSGAILGGVDGLKQALHGVFESLVKDFGKNLADQVLIAFGASPDEELRKTGAGKGAVPLSQSEIENITKASQQRANLLKAGATAITGIMQAATEQMTDFQAGLSAVVTGVSTALALSVTTLASAAPYVGIIVAAAVFIAHLLQSSAAKAKLPEATVTFGETPGAGFYATTSGRNITDEQRLQIAHAAAETANSFFNSYILILQKFSGQLADMMKGLRLFGGRETFGPSNDIQAQINAWIEQGLPDQIQRAFWEPIANGLASIGFSQARIEQLRQMANEMDPKIALAFISSLVDAGIGIADQLAKLKLASGFSGGTGGPGFVFDAGSLLESFNMSNSYFDQLSKTDTQIRDLAEGLSTLTGQAQVDQMNQINSMLADRYQKELQFIGQIQSAIDGITKSFDAAIRANELSLLKTPEGQADIPAQVNYLNEYLKQLERQITTATDPGKLSSLGQEILATIEQIKQLGGSVSAADMENYTKWALDAEKTVRDAILARLKVLGDEAASESRILFDAIQGFVDVFLQGTQALIDAVAQIPGPPVPPKKNIPDQPDADTPPPPEPPPPPPPGAPPRTEPPHRWEVIDENVQPPLAPLAPMAADYYIPTALPAAAPTGPTVADLVSAVTTLGTKFDALLAQSQKSDATEGEANGLLSDIRSILGSDDSADTLNAIRILLSAQRAVSAPSSSRFVERVQAGRVVQRPSLL